MRETAPPKWRELLALRTRLSTYVGRGKENVSLRSHCPHPCWELQGACSGWAGQRQEEYPWVSAVSLCRTQAGRSLLWCGSNRRGPGQPPVHTKDGVGRSAVYQSRLSLRKGGWVMRDFPDV